MKSPVKVQQVNWYSFKHEQVCERFKLDRFVNTFCVSDEYEPVAVYHSPNPDRDKGHKDYVLLQILTDSHTDERVLCVRGMDAAEIDEFRYQDAIICLDCKDLVYSVMRHDMRYCSCGACFVDGGRDYLSYGGKNLENIQKVTLDLLTNNWYLELSAYLN